MNILGARIGYGAGTEVGNLDDLRAQARWAEDAGFDSFWLSQIFGLDPIVALAAIAAEVPALAELGTSVVPMPGRHPMSLAPAVLTAQAACEGRFTLGIGPSHQIVAEGFFGESYARPYTRTKEFVQALDSLVTTGATELHGEEIFASGWLTIDAPPVPILLAALGPRMLEFAGATTAGTTLGSCGPTMIKNFVAPTINAAAAAAGRPKPRIVALVSVGITDNPADLRAEQRKASALYDQLPSYRSALDREGVESGTDLTLLGDADTLVAGLARYVDAGATDLRVGIVRDADGSDEATKTFLADLVGRSAS